MTEPTDGKKARPRRTSAGGTPEPGRKGRTKGIVPEPEPTNNESAEPLSEELDVKCAKVPGGKYNVWLILGDKPIENTAEAIDLHSDKARRKYVKTVSRDVQLRPEGNAALLKNLRSLSIEEAAKEKRKRTDHRDAGEEEEDVVEDVGEGYTDKLPNGEPAYRIYLKSRTSRGTRFTPISRFTAKILYETERLDGVESTRTYTVVGETDARQKLPEIDVMAGNKFAEMEWVCVRWGARAIIIPGKGNKEALATAMKILSAPIPNRSKYLHTGWTKAEGGKHLFLSAGAVIGAEPGSVAMELDGPLARYSLPEPPTGDALARAVAASLLIPDTAPDRITCPLLAAAYRAPLGHCGFGLFLLGSTQVFKSQLAGLIQQHFGALMDGDHLPSNWKSTANALEGLAFLAKDCVLVFDDFKAVTLVEQQKLEESADRLFRGQANNSSRQRANVHGGLRASRPSRCLPVATGEQLPETPSTLGRMLIVEVRKGDVDIPLLTARQTEGREGMFAQAMGGYLRWLIPRIEKLPAEIEAETLRIRSGFHRDGMLPRTCEQLAELYLGVRTWLDFSLEVGAIDRIALREYLERFRRGLLDAGDRQRDHQTGLDPVTQFQRSLGAALISGIAHLMPIVMHPQGEACEVYGWQKTAAAGTWEPRGAKVGWVDEEYVYLDPDASFAAARRLAESSGKAISYAAEVVWRAMVERDIVKVEKARKTIFARKMIHGHTHAVLNLRRDRLTILRSAKADQPELREQGGE